MSTDDEARQQLQAKWQEHLELPFPKSLADFKADLVELDSGIAGLVTWFLDTGQVPQKFWGLITLDTELDKRLSSFRAETDREQALLGEYQRYKRAIDDLTRSLARCIGKPI